LGVPFTVHVAAVDETAWEGEPPDSYMDRVTLAKLAAVAGGRPEANLLVADTVVVAPGGEMLGKPGNVDEAAAMIERLVETTHEVRTRFVLAGSDLPGRAVHAETVITRVTFRHLEPSEIAAYARSGEGNDKAGGYAAQGRAAAFIERIEGSYTNVVGLPLCELSVALRSLGWWSEP
jgi:septum formation protein